MLVHGTSSGRRRWLPVLDKLPGDRAYWMLDRRGRGLSGDQARYALSDEVADIAAVAEAAKAEEIVAHSYGAILALEAALELPRLRRIVLYEPPVPVPPCTPDPVDEANIAAIGAEVEAGRRDEAVTIFMRDVLKMPPASIAAVRGGADWQARVDLAATLPRELAAVRAYRFQPEKFRNCRFAVLLLLGSDSPKRYVDAMQMLAEGLPNARIERLEGQRHNAISEAPDLFSSAVGRFLQD
ncbi:alpha/beta hydrolase [Roseiarcaceae bacterium H3SJ34-1]|nr:alpha/beta hydrolase [Roseiarcaceae bacterium H3SJ34-1]